MFTINPLLKVDSYKLSHKDQYPEGLENVYSNFTSRGSRVPGVNHTVNFGLQYFLTDLQSDFEAFFAADKDEVIADYQKNTASFVAPGFSVEMIADLHDLGYLPLRFSQLPEGTLVPIKVPSITIESTHKDFAWLVNYFETNLSATIWHPSTSATTAWDLRRVLDKAAAETSSTPEAVDFQLHDFSYRGMENWQAAAASSAGHLLSFYGSDVVPVVPWVNYYYPGEENGLIAASVPATEHSVMCAGGKDGEKETIRRLLKTYPEGILSIVMDTWDLFHVLTVTLPELKDEIMARKGTLVVRPDSGDPADIVAGLNTKPGYITTADIKTIEKNPEYFGAMEILWETFGGVVNDKGFKELDSHISLIYGDGMHKERIKDINRRLASKGFASTVWVAGIGSLNYQLVTRDTFGSAVKATQVTVKGEVRNIFKDPKTDNGLKKSATGRLSVQYKMDGELYLTDKATPEQEAASLIQPVWENGKFIRTQSFANVRAELRRHTAILTRAGKLS